MHTAMFTDSSKPLSDTLLVVIDMQKDFVNGSLGTKEAQNIIDNVVSLITKHKGPIAYTLDTHQDNYLETSEGKKLPVRHCIKGEEGHELIDELQLLLKDARCFEKPTFGSVELARAIADDATIKKVELAGVCTDICVVSNALLIKAMRPDLEINVHASCCAGTTDSRHKSALETMSSCQIEVI